MRLLLAPTVIASLILGVLLLGAIALWTLSISSHDDWKHSILYTDLPEVSGLQSLGSSIYVTFETRNYDGKLVSIVDGVRSTIVSGLQKPDGLTTSLGSLVYTQEFGESPVYEVIDGIPHGLFMADGAEGIDSTLNGDLYVIEDRPGAAFSNMRDRQVKHLNSRLNWKPAKASAPWIPVLFISAKGIKVSSTRSRTEKFPSILRG